MRACWRLWQPGRSSRAQAVPLLPLADAALRGAVLALLGLAVVSVLHRRMRGPAATIAVAMALGLAVQVVSSMPWFEARVPRVWQAPLVGISVANAVLFWIFASALFIDGFRPRAMHRLAWAAAALLGLINCAVVAGSGSALEGAALVAQRLVAPVCAVLAAWAAVAHWRADLVEWRRRLRGVLVGTGVAYTLVQVGMRLTSPNGRLSEWAALLDVLVLLAVAAITAWDQLAPPDTVPRPARGTLADTALAPAQAVVDQPVAADPQAAPASDPDPAEMLLAQALVEAMEQQHVYRSEALTVTSLATRLAVPEYRLRRLINQRLGHRNFNSFVNGYRLAAARAMLADPARRQWPILSIALEAGFQSIGPFNRAFKAQTGLTPSEFRAQHHADSGIGQPHVAV